MNILSVSQFSSTALNLGTLAVKNFGLISNTCLVAMGLKEAYYDHISTLSQTKSSEFENSESKLSSKHKVILNPEFTEIQKIMNQFSLVHGVFFYASGTFGVASCLHQFFSGIPPLFTLGCSISSYALFFFINLYSIERNIQIYQHADKMGAETTDDQLKDLANKLKISAVLGILNNLGYALAAIFAAVPGMQAVAIALALFAVFNGAIKIIIDYFSVTPRIFSAS